MCIVGILRSPLRPTMGERLFKWLWGGRIGRTILALMTLGMRHANAGGPALAPARPASLEARVAALEEWRKRVEKLTP